MREKLRVSSLMKVEKLEEEKKQLHSDVIRARATEEQIRQCMKDLGPEMYEKFLQTETSRKGMVVKKKEKVPKAEESGNQCRTEYEVESLKNELMRKHEQ